MLYAPFFCEENVWHLCRDETVRGSGGWVPPPDDRRAVFVTSAGRAVAVWRQRAGNPVVWDYHVLLLARRAPGGGWDAWDLDTTLGLPVPLGAYLAASFPEVDLPREHRPLFRVVTASDLLARFSSDRSHMQDNDGNPRAPFPPWPPIQTGGVAMNLPRFIDPADASLGEWVTLDALVRAYGE